MSGSETSSKRLREPGEVITVLHELVTPSRHRQAYRVGWRYANRTRAVIQEHVTEHPSLIRQLRDAISDRPGNAKSGSAFSTTLPRFSVDAYDRMARIRVEVSEWCGNLGIELRSAKNAARVMALIADVERVVKSNRIDPIGLNDIVQVLRNYAEVTATAVEPDIAALVDKVPRLSSPEVDELGASAEQWRTWCRIIAGWEDAPLRPHVPCPNCGVLAGERAGLRIRIEAAGGTGGLKSDAAMRAAVCLSCNRTWEAEHFGLLAAQIREAQGLVEESTDVVDSST